MEKIYMIPVNDAYSSATECPFCALHDKAENDYLEYYLGPSLMEPDTRKITNKTGFCPEHMGKLNKAVTNRLGLGLVMHTHLKDFNEDLNPKLKASIPAKAGLSLLGLCTPEMRLPLTTAVPSTFDAMKHVLVDLGI